MNIKKVDKMKLKRLRLLLFLSQFLIGGLIFAQNGNSCLTSISLNDNNCLDSISSSDSIIWFSFVLTSPSLEISIFNYQAGTPGTHFYNDIKLFSSCNGVAVATAYPDAPVSYVLRSQTLIPNVPYYLKLQRHEIDLTLFKVCLLPVTFQPCTCLPGGYNPNNPCDAICNGGFENLNSGVFNWDQVIKACPWYSLALNSVGSYSSPDLFNTNYYTASGSPPPPGMNVPMNIPGTESSCNGGTNLGGNGYAGFITHETDISTYGNNYREFIVQKFASPLPAGTYDVKFYVSLAECSGYATDCIGAWLSTTAPSQIASTNVVMDANLNSAAPQIISSVGIITNSNGWIPISGTFTTSGGEQYITIGSFCSDANNNSQHLSPTCTGAGHASMALTAYYFLDSVTVHPVGAIISTGPNQTICSGSSATLSATISGVSTSYDWSGPSGIICSGCTSTIVNPTTTTTYTFTAHNNSCNPISTTTIFVNPLPNVQITGLLANNCQSGVISYNAPCQPGVNYFWSLSGGNSNSLPTGCNFDVNWSLAGGSLTLTATDGNNCTNTNTIIIPACCSVPVPGPTLFFTNTSASVMVLAHPNNMSGANFTATNIVISGLFTIDIPSFNLLNCPNIKLRTNARIEILPGASLGIIQSHLGAACNLMWDGIYIDNQSASLTISNNSIIQDSKNAVVSILGGIFTIDHTQFINDLKGIIVNPFNGNHQGTVSSSTFTKLNSSPFLQTFPSYPSYINKTLIGIEITDNANITIGDATNASNQNHFQNIHTGIRTINSITNVINCEFRDLGFSIFVPNSGTAIVAEAPKNFSYIPAINVGGVQVNQTCIFDNIYIGLDAKNYVNINLTNNNIAKIRLFGVRAQTCISRNINIQNNVLSNASSSVVFNTGILLLDCYNAHVNISGNSILQNSGNPANQIGIGIHIALAVPGSISLDIGNNISISKVQTGILLEQLQGLNNVNVHDNTISFTKSNAFYTATSVHYGIRLEHCATVRVRYNNIIKSNPPNPTAAMQQNLRGISLGNSSGILVSHNTITRMGSGIFGWEDCHGSTLACNTLDHCFDGFFFTGGLNTGGACNIGDQVADPIFSNTFHPTGNTWFPITAAGQADIAGYIQPAVSWFYNGYVPITLMLPGSFLPTLNNVPVVSTNNSACSIIQFLSPTPVVERQQNTGQVVLDPNSYASGTQMLYLARRDAHNKLRRNQNWMNLNSPQDSLFQGFYTTNDQSNIGLFRNFEDMVSVDSISLAMNTLSSVIDTNLSETNLKTVYSIYNNSWTQGQYFFSSADSTTLYNIAVLHASDAGDAVYSARVLMNLQVDEFGNSNSNRLMQFTNQTPVEESSVFEIFPNPSNGLANVIVQIEDGETGQLQIIDVTGKVIAVQNVFSSGNYKFETGNLDQGLYFIEFIKNGAITETKKMQVIKQ